MSRNKKTEQKEKKFSDSGIEKFPKPRTMPDNWDVSGLTPSKAKAIKKGDESDEIFEKFPKPRTMPINWDTTVLPK